ncbi:DMT family transporter [Parasalinivibrio latis]|uniref:DMT family transporter n=1 Tax=Parasalinivibrio latis TaxID=2952610 RepID=UPI0030DFC322
MLKIWAPFFFVLLWSTGFIGAKFGLPYADPATFLFVRMIFNILMFIVLMALLNASYPMGRQAFHAMVSGVLIHAGYLGGVFAAINHGMPTGLSSLIVGTQPLLTALLLVILTAERLKKSQWIGLVIGVVGVALVVQGKMTWPTYADKTWAYVFVLSALAGITLGTLYQKKYCQGIELVGCAFWQYVASALFLFPLAWTNEGLAIEWSTTFILALAWSVVVLSGVAVLLLLYMIRQGAASKVTSVMYLVPPVTAFQGWLFFDEAFGLTGLLGFMLASLSVYLVMKTA